MIKLTDKDKTVFYSIIRWPHLNDTELSKKTNIKRSTITAIRNKLEKNKLYTTIKAPDLERLGCELLTVRYGGFNPLASYKVREKYTSTQKFPEVFFKRSTDRQRMALSAAENFTEVKKYIDYSNRVYGEHDFLTDEGIIHVFFPYKVSRIFRFFDYAPLLRQHFNLDFGGEQEVVDTNFLEKEKAELSENEKQVLYALVKYPQQNDNKVARKVSMTRQSVSAIRKKLEKEGFVKRINIPNLEALDFQILALTHIMVNPKSTLVTRKHGVQEVLNQGVHIFYISGNLEFVLISAYKDYPEYNKEYDRIISYYKEHDLLLKDPVTKIFITSDLRLSVDGRFALLVKKIMGIKAEV